MASESTSRRLAFIRYLYGLAVNQSRQPEPQRAASVLTFHDSVELFLQLASEHKNAGAKDCRFLEYWEILEGKASCRLTAKESMRRLAAARGLLKHHGTMPSALDIEDFRAATANFFADNTPIVFGIEFDSVSLVDLLTCAEARSKLAQAEAHTVKGEIEEALQDIALAFAFLVEDYERGERTQPERLVLSNTLSAWSLESKGVDSELARFAEEGSRALKDLQSTVRILSLGLDHRRYNKFWSLTPRVDFYLGGGMGLWAPKYTVPPTTEDARACAEFVIDCALRLQEGGGEFIQPEQPRGKAAVLRAWATGEISRRSDSPDKNASEGQGEKPFGRV